MDIYLIIYFYGCLISTLGIFWAGTQQAKGFSQILGTITAILIWPIILPAKLIKIVIQTERRGWF